MLKLFFKRCLKSFWIWIGIVSTGIGILANYFDGFKNISYMTELLIGIVIISIIVDSYKLFSKTLLEYPEVIVEEKEMFKIHNNKYFKLKKIKFKRLRKYRINIIEDDRPILINDSGENYVTLGLYHKIYIKNSMRRNIEVLKPRIKILSVNNNENNFLIKRLKVLLEKEGYWEERYNEWFSGLCNIEREKKCKFPYKVDNRKSKEIYLYIQLSLESLTKEEFDELLLWIRNIKLQIEINIRVLNKIKKQVYIMEYTYKSKLIENMIKKRKIEEEKFKNTLREF